jgi:hypothetical protein
MWLTREMLASEALRGLSVNARRALDFLMIEAMNHAGTENGALKGTHRQLVAFGIHPKNVADAIAEVEAAGFVDCHRGGMRVATTYRLTWLPDRDGAPATNRWKARENQKSATPVCSQSATPVCRQMPAKLETLLERRRQKSAKNPAINDDVGAVSLHPPYVGPSISTRGPGREARSSEPHKRPSVAGAVSLDVERRKALQSKIWPALSVEETIAFASIPNNDNILAEAEMAEAATNGGGVMTIRQAIANKGNHR